jgi:hypothetical protein
MENKRSLNLAIKQNEKLWENEISSIKTNILYNLEMTQ